MCIYKNILLNYKILNLLSIEWPILVVFITLKQRKLMKMSTMHFKSKETNEDVNQAL